MKLVCILYLLNGVDQNKKDVGKERGCLWFCFGCRHYPAAFLSAFISSFFIPACFFYFGFFFITFPLSLSLFVSHMELWLHKDDKPDWPDLICCLWFLVLLCFVSGSSHSVIPFPIFCMFSCLSVIVSFFPCYILSPPISSFPLSVYTIYPFLRLPFLTFHFSFHSFPSFPPFLPSHYFPFLSFPFPPLTTCALWWFVPDIPPHVHTHTEWR